MSKIARIPVSSLPSGVPGFVRWARVAHPQVYRAVAARLASQGLAGDDFNINLPGTDPVAAAAAKPGLAAGILSAFTDLVKVGLPLYQQNKLFELQVKRAQQDKPPLDTSRIADGSAFRVGLDSATRNTGMIIGGTIAGGLLLFALLRRRS